MNNIPFNVIKDIYILKDSHSYEEIYRKYGKILYNFFAPNEYKKKDIEKLLADNNYKELQEKYGSMNITAIKNLKIYSKKLIDEKKFIELQRLFPSKVKIKQIMAEDILYSTGSKVKYKLYKTKVLLKSTLKFSLQFIVEAAILTSIFLPLSFSNYLSALYDENTYKYKDLIDKYESRVDEYVSNFHSLNLTTDQVIMKVLDDTWNDYKGYGNPEYDITGYTRLDFAEKNGVGICRNMADNFTYIMNQIWPNCNAMNMIVYLDSNNLSKSEQTNLNYRILEHGSSNSEYNATDEELSKIIGNHMISILKPKDCPCYLAVDSTNGFIGIIDRGKIVIVDSNNDKGLKFVPIGELAQTIGMKDDYKEIKKILFESTINHLSKEELTDIVQKYNVENLNNDLEYVRELENSRNVTF